MDHTALLGRLENVQAEIVRAALRAENQPQPSGEWTLRTILIHLALVEEVIWQARLKQMAEQVNPHWVWTEPSLDEAIAQQGQRPLVELAELFTKSRKQTVAHLEGFTEEGWARVGTHARLGHMDVAGLCAQILEHDEEHLAELNKRAQAAIP
jgi:DinB superfamily